MVFDIDRSVESGMPHHTLWTRLSFAILQSCPVRRLFEAHEFWYELCSTTRRVGTAAEQAGYDVLITVDMNIPHPADLSGRRISVIVLDGRSTLFDDLVVLMPKVLAALDGLQAGHVVRVGFR